jgi:regulator of extracellular matrix RemA (YlzA/DUF370 family)
MNRYSGFVGTAARALLTGTFVLTLGAAEAALGQDALPASDAPVGTGAETAADQPRRGRDRRRSQEVAAATRAPEPAAVAATDSTTAVLAAPQAETIEARIVCKNVKLTGTKISRRICGTPEQWAAQQQKTNDDAQEAMRQVRDRSSVVVSQQENPLSPGGR